MRMMAVVVVVAVVIVLSLVSVLLIQIVPVVSMQVVLRDVPPVSQIPIHHPSATTPTNGLNHLHHPRSSRNPSPRQEPSRRSLPRSYPLQVAYQPDPLVVMEGQEAVVEMVGWLEVAIVRVSLM
jgi:hypothetical protein